jgi:RNA polymerase sigma factor (TIGR02999 family)
MRSILASAARKRQTLRRGEGMRFVAWDDSLQPLAQDDRELVALDDALSELEQLEPRHAQMIEWHFFGGMKWTEVAEALNLPLTTVERDWRVLRAWLADVVRRSPMKD